MSNKLTWLAELASANVSQRQLVQRFHGIAEGQRVHIVGAGPSGAQFEPPAGEHVILCNSAVKRFVDASPELAKYLSWITMENRACYFPWFWDNEQFAGAIVAEKYMAVNMPDVLYHGYSEQFWQRVTFSERIQWDPNPAVQPPLADWLGGKTQQGLCYVSGRFDPVGSVALQAAHLGVFMHAAELHFYGCEFSFPEGQQHADGWAPYEEADDSVYREETTDHQTQVVRARVKANGEVVLDPEGDIQTTPYFIKSAAAIKQVLDAQEGLVWRDHSGGLLSAGERHHRTNTTSRSSSAAHGKAAGCTSRASASSSQGNGS